MLKHEEIGLFQGIAILYNAIIRACMLTLGAWAALGLVLLSLYLFSFLFQVQFFSEYKNFLNDFAALSDNPGPFAELDFFKKYQVDRGTIQMAAGLTPARSISLLTIPLSTYDQSWFFLSLGCIFVSILFLQIYIPRFYGLAPYALEESKKSWALSIGIVAILAGIQSYLDYTPAIAQAGIHPLYFWLITLSMTYCGGYIFFLLRYIVDGYLLSKGKDPQQTWVDEAVILAIAVPFLFVAGNGLLDISFEAIAGMSPFLITKLMGWKWETPGTPTPDVDIMFATKGFYLKLCDMFLGFSIILSVVFGIIVFADLSKSTETDKNPFAGEERALAEKINAKLYTQYIQGKNKNFHERSLNFLKSSLEKEQLNTVAAIYAWTGQKEIALELAKKAKETTFEQVHMLLEGKTPQEVENFFQKITTKYNMMRKINGILWQQYLRGKDKNFKQRWLDLLRKSSSKSYLDTVAVVYAWTGNREKAHEIARQAIPDTLLRISLLLEGKTPKKVEEVVKYQKTINKKLRQQYQQGTYKKFKQSLVEVLAKSAKREHRDTAAVIYAWTGNHKKALELAKQALPETEFRVKSLLKGKSPKEVESAALVRQHWRIYPKLKKKEKE